MITATDKVSYEDARYFASLAVIPTMQIDWGSSRGQGKRIGTGVLGAMSDVSLKGIKTYSDYRNAEGVTDSIWEHIRVMLSTDHDLEADMTIGLLQLGLSENDALTLVYSIDYEDRCVD